MGYAPSNNNDLTGARVQGICPAGFHIPSDLEWARYAYCQESAVAPTGPTPLATFQNPAGFGWMGSTAPGVGPGEKMKTPFGSFTPAWTGSNASGQDVGGIRVVGIREKLSTAVLVSGESPFRGDVLKLQ